MQIDSTQSSTTQSYSILFNRCRLAMVSPLDMESLKMFNAHNQKRLGKINIHLDINYLKGLPRNLDYILMSDYKQIVPIIYLMRGQSSQCKIISTKPLLQFALIYAQDFYTTIKKINLICDKPTYDEQSQTLDNYEKEYNIDLSKWVQIYQKQQIHKIAQKCVQINYGQIYESQKGIKIIAFPSGEGIGTAVWILQNCQTKRRCLWVQGISHHAWRACRQFEINPFYDQIDDIIFMKGALRCQSETLNDQQQCLEFLKAFQQRLQRSLNTRIVISDSLLIADIINYLSFQFKDKLKRIFFTGSSVNNLMSYTNSYVQFLNPNHQRRIYEDPPVYPFETYEQFRHKIIGEGTIEQISTENKVPVKQMILRSTPYLHFETDYHAYLFQGENQVVENMFQKYFSLQKLKDWLSNIKVGRIIYFCSQGQTLKNIHDLGHPFQLKTIGESIYLPYDDEQKYYTAEGTLPFLISSYTKKNGWLKLSQVQHTFRKMSKNWYTSLSDYFMEKNISVQKAEENILETLNSRIQIIDFKIRIKSDSQDQLRTIHQWLNQNTKLFKLG